MTPEKLQHLIRPANPVSPHDQFCLLRAYKRIGGDKYPMPVWDDGSGRLWAVWEPVGNFANICGLVRASTWEKALECAVDEVIADPYAEEIKAYAAASPDVEELPEGWQWRGSGNPSNGNKFPFLKTQYADASDIQIQPLRVQDLEEFRIRLVWETYACGSYNGPIYRNET